MGDPFLKPSRRLALWQHQYALFMGAYLSQPVTEKDTYSGANEYLEFGGASMQVESIRCLNFRLLSTRVYYSSIEKALQSNHTFQEAQLNWLSHSEIAATLVDKSCLPRSVSVGERNTSSLTPEFLKEAELLLYLSVSAGMA